MKNSVAFLDYRRDEKLKNAHVKRLEFARCTTFSCARPLSTQKCFCVFLCCFSPYRIFRVRLVALHVPHSGEADLWSVLHVNEVWSPVELGL